MRPIDGDLIVRCAEQGQMRYGKGNHPRRYLDWPQLKYVVEKCPTLDMTPVRHGHWIEVHEEDGYDYDCWMCSECEHLTQHDFALIEEAQAIGDMLYCQHCGAKMDQEV